MELTQTGMPVPGCGDGTGVAALAAVHHVARQILAAGGAAGLTGRAGRAVGAGGVAGAARALHRRGRARSVRVAHRRQRQHAARARLARAAQRARALVGRLHADHRAGRARRRAVLARVGRLARPGPRCTTTQLPALHTRFVPQTVPSGWFEPLSVHIGVPVEQVERPGVTGIGGHAGAAARCMSTQLPALHTMFAPQLRAVRTVSRLRADRRAGRARRRARLARVGRLAARARRARHAGARVADPVGAAASRRSPATLPVSVQPIVGVQTVMPGVTRVRGHADRPRRAGRAGAALADHVGAARRCRWARCRTRCRPACRCCRRWCRGGTACPGTVQVMPATHAAQTPLAPHTMSVPHDVPAATLVPLSVQVGAAPEQTSVPLWHLFVGVHAAARLAGARTSPPGRPSRCRSPCRSACCPSPCRRARPSCRRCCRRGTACRSRRRPCPPCTRAGRRCGRPCSAPQTVPFACRSVSSMQVIAPSLQTNIPLWHGLAGHARAAGDTVADGNVDGTRVDEHRIARARIEGVAAARAARAAARARAAAARAAPPRPRPRSCRRCRRCRRRVRDRQLPQPAATARERRGAGNEDGDPEAIFKQHRATS